MNILNVGYGTTNPQTLFHLVQCNVALRLEDPRNNVNSVINIDFKRGSGTFGNTASGASGDWRLSSSNTQFNIEKHAYNLTSNILSINENGNITVANDIIIGGNFIKNGNNVITDVSNYINAVDSNLNTIINTTVITSIDSNNSNVSNYIQAVDSNLNNIINTTVLTSIDSNNSNVSNYIQAVDSNLNVIINTTVLTSIDSNNSNVSNYIQAVDSNLNNIINTTVLTSIDSNNSNVSNYIQAVDSNLNVIINTTVLTSIDSNNSNVSNYIQVVDSNLNNIINTKDANISNYTSIVNVRVREFVNTKDANMSNYVINIDSRLSETIAIRDANISNYTLSVNNRLTSNINTRDGNVSNYVLAVNNRITASLNTKEAALSNYSLNINDRLSGIISVNDNTMSNFLLNNSNTLALRINNITTDEINKGINNKFIVNNYHNDILNVAGKFNIFSNSNFVDIVNVYEDNINSNTILKILQNGRVGIGSSQPSEKLDVSGNINITGNYMVNNEVFKTSQWTTKNESIYFNISNVGIGTDSPGSLLALRGNKATLKIQDPDEVNENVSSIELINGSIDNISSNQKYSWKIANANNKYIISSANITSNIKDRFVIDGPSGNIGINTAPHTGLDNNLDTYKVNIGGSINIEGYLYNNGKLYEATAHSNMGVLAQNMPVQTFSTTYRKKVEMTSNLAAYDVDGWQFIDEDLDTGFVIKIKPSHISSKILVNLSCHIGFDSVQDTRWWGLKLYRKFEDDIGWTEVSDANGSNNVGEEGTECWLSNNLGSSLSSYEYFVANVSGAFFDQLPAETPYNKYVYYTAKWKSKLGNTSINFTDGKLYLNRPSQYNATYSPSLSSSWTAQEIWQLGTPFIPSEGSHMITFKNQNVGIGNSNPQNDLDISGDVNITGVYKRNNVDIIQQTNDNIATSSNLLNSKIDDLSASLFYYDPYDLKISNILLPRATCNNYGAIKPDNITIKIDSNGIISGNQSVDLSGYATKNDLDSVSSGLTFIDPVELATTVNITYPPTGLIQIDGVFTALNNRVLVKNQNLKYENGIYTASTTAWSRSEDFNSTENIKSGTFVFVKNGNINKSSGFVFNTSNFTALGTDPINFTQFSSAGQITGGIGIVKDANNLNLNIKDEGGIEIDGNNQIYLNLGLANITSVLPVAKGGTGSTTLDNLINLSAHTTGILPIAKGGTGASSLNNLINLSSHTTGILPASKGGSGKDILALNQLLVGNDTGAVIQSDGLTWANNTLVATNISGSGTGITFLNADNVSSGILAIERGGTGASSLNNLINLSTHTNGILPVSKGGTGAGLLIANRLIIGNGDNSLLQSENLTWNNISSILSATNITANTLTGSGANITALSAANISTGILSVSRGGTGVGSFVQNQLIVGNGTNAPIQSTSLSWNNLTNTLTVANIAGSGENITGLNINNISAGILPVSKGGTGTNSLAANQLVVGNAGNTPIQSANLTWDNAANILAATNIAGNGALLTALNADNITTGTLPIARGGTGSSTLTADIIEQGTVKRFIENDTITMPNIPLDVNKILYMGASIVPTLDNIFSLGSADKKWKDIFVSANTITIGEAKLSASPTGALEMSSISFVDKINLVTSNELHSLSGITKNVQRQINELNLDNIANGVTNKYIINNQFDGELTVGSRLNVGAYYSTENQNGDLHIFGDLILEGNITTNSPFITQIHRNLSNYNTGYIDIYNIDDSSNKPSVKIRHNTGYSNVLECYSKDDNNINNALFIITSNGNIGIANDIPTEKLDIIGNIKYTGKINNITAGEMEHLSGINYNIKQRIADNDARQSNYVLNISNILYIDYSNRDANISNFVVDVRGALDEKIISSNNILYLYASNNDISNSNYILGNISNLNNVIVNNNINISNYISATSNQLSESININDNSLSNYVKITSNELISFVKNNGGNQIDFIIETSNALFKYSFDNNIYQSNYVAETSNILIAYSSNININLSNYILLTSSNLLRNASNINVNLSNYILATSNNLIRNANNINTNLSNYVLTTSNYLINYSITGERALSNYVISTSNTLNTNLINFSRNAVNITQGLINSDRLPVATADKRGAIKKGTNLDILSDGTLSVILDVYEGNTFIKGDLITSNLTVLGSSTILDTNVYITERLEIINDSLNNAVDIRQKANGYNIMNISNLTSEVFNIGYNGGITFSNSINNISVSEFAKIANITANDENVSNYVEAVDTRLSALIAYNDVDTSNYIKETSNVLAVDYNRLNGNASNYVEAVDTRLSALIAYNDVDTSNYIKETSNILATDYNRLNGNVSNFVEAVDSRLSALIAYNDVDTCNYIKDTSNVLAVDYNRLNGNASNYIGAVDTRLSALIAYNDVDTSNYVKETSNVLATDYNRLNGNASNFITSVDTRLSALIAYNDTDTSNYVKETSNVLAVDYNRLNGNASNFITSVDTRLSALIAYNDTDTSNYIKETSNVLATDYNRLNGNASNFITSVDTRLSALIAFNDTDTSNYIKETSNILAVDYNRLNGNASNYIEAVDTRLSALIAYNDVDTSNYIKETSNVLATDYNRLNGNASNFITSVDTRLSALIAYNDTDTSNYVKETSNILATDYNRLNGNASNYIGAVDSRLSALIAYNDTDTSNYVKETSNVLATDYNRLNGNASNYIEAVDTRLSALIAYNDTDTCNYIKETSNILASSINYLYENAYNDMKTLNVINYSNYLVTSNKLQLPIATTAVLGGVKQGTNTSINADGIISVNLSTYAGNAIIDGNLTTSNLTVLGSTTTLDTDVYITERLEILNDSLNNAVIIKQKAPGYNIINVSNLTSEVFSIGYNGNITFSETINNITTEQFSKIANLTSGDINVSNYIEAVDTRLSALIAYNDTDTSNYIKETSNVLATDYNRLNGNASNFITSVDTRLSALIAYNDTDTSNYVKETSNVLATDYNRLNGNASNFITSVDTRLSALIAYNDTDTSNYVKETSNVLAVDYNRLNGNVSNFITSVDTRLSALIAYNDTDTCNYIKETSNVLAVDYNRLNGNVSNFITSVDTRLSALIAYNDTDTCNYIKETSNVLATDYNRLNGNASNFIGAVDTRLSALIAYNDTDTCNYIKETSNVLAVDYNRLNGNVSNFIGAVDTRLSALIAYNDTDTCNYIKETSNVLASSINYLYDNSYNDQKTLNVINNGSYLIASNKLQLPIATSAVLGGVKQGTNTSINADGIISVNLSTYTGNAIINGNLTTSNLTVLGSTTTLDTNVYITERLEIFNDSLNNAVIIKQKTPGYNIMNVSNLTSEVFSIGYNGNITFSESINNITKEQFSKIANLTASDVSVSNYVDAIDSRLSSLITVNDNRASNYVRVASNLLAIDYKRLDSNVSNYVGALDTRVSSLITVGDDRTSNYVRVASNLLAIDYKRLDSNVSNYLGALDTRVSSLITVNDDRASNYVRVASNIIISTVKSIGYITASTLPKASDVTLGGVKVDGSTITIDGAGVISGANTYVLPVATTGTLGGVRQGTNTAINASGIISVDLSTYTGNAIINGNLTTSNLTVLGSTTTLDTNVYITERLEIFNDSLNNAVIIKQKTPGYNIMNVSNLTSEVFSIGYNGGITFSESINNITATQFNQIANITTNDNRASNYVRVASNLLAIDYKRLDSNVSNYVGALDTRISSLITVNDNRASNYVRVASNLLVIDYKRLDSNVSNYVGALDTRISSLITVNDDRASNYVRVASNLLVVDYKRLDSNVSNYVSASSNTLVLDYRMLDANVSNYVSASSNTLVLDYRMLDANVSNYVRATSNFLYNNYSNLIANIAVSGGGTTTIVSGGGGGLSYWKNVTATTKNTIYYGAPVKIGGDKLVDVANNYIMDIVGNVRVSGTITTGWSGDGGGASDGGVNSVGGGGGDSYWTAIESSKHIYYTSNVKIGGASNVSPTNKLEVTGNISATGQIISGFSDNRLKTITSNINNSMDIISKLNGFYYIPNDIAINNCSAKNKEDIGLSAQDVNEILPHIVNLAPFDCLMDNSNNLISKSGCNYLTVNYEKLAPVFIEAIKTLNEKIVYLTNEIEKLKARD